MDILIRGIGIKIKSMAKESLPGRMGGNMMVSGLRVSNMEKEDI